MPIYWSPEMYVIERQTGEFVSDPSTNGTGSSFTRNIEKAVQFSSREAAQRECCENERPRQINTARAKR